MAASTADFEFGQRFELWDDFELGRQVVQGSGQRLVATLPRSYVGEAITRTDRWSIDIERGRFGWRMVARGGRDGPEAGRVSARLLPFSYGITLAFGATLRLTEHPLSHTWVVSDGARRLARISEVSSALTSSGTGPRLLLSTIETSDAHARSATPIALPLILALMMIKATATIPEVAAADAGG